MTILQRPLHALYYPEYEPDPAWLRAQLLFFDKIESIIPKEEDWKPKPENDALFQRLPDVFEPVRQDAYLPEDYQIDWETFDRACKEIVEYYTPKPNLFVEDFSRVTPHHRSKMNTCICERLVSNSVASVVGKNFDPMSPEGHGESYLLDTEASFLVMGIVAEFLAQQRGLRCITKRPIEHYFNLCNGYKTLAAIEYEGALAAYLIKMTIPQDIMSIPVEEYIEIRRRHEGMREIYRNFLADLARGFDLDKITCKKELIDRVREIGNKVGVEVEKERTANTLRAKVNQWAPSILTVGCSFLPIAFPDDMGVELASMAGVVEMQLVEKVSQKPVESLEARTMKMMASLQNDLRERLIPRRLLSGMPLA